MNEGLSVSGRRSRETRRAHTLRSRVLRAIGAGRSTPIARWLGVVVGVVALAACSSSDDSAPGGASGSTPDAVANPIPNGGTSSGNVGAQPPAQVGGTPSEGINGMIPIGSGGAAPVAAGGTAPVVGGAGGTAPGIPSVALGPCQVESFDTPCGTIQTPAGSELALGPSGSVMDVNVGAGFENAIASGDASPLGCQVFALTFGEDAAMTERLLDTEFEGQSLDFALYTVFRPANTVPGAKYPLLTWGNGTCAQPAGYAPLLHYLASHGFFVVAPNNRWVGGAAEMLRSLDFMLAANDDPTSPYYQLIDTDKIGSMGHSQGGVGALNASADPRVKVTILFNGGTEASKPFLALSGDFDIGGGTDPTPFVSQVSSAPKSAYLWYHQVPQTGNFSGHLTLMLEPERVVEAAMHWWRYMLQGNAESREFFVGPNCTLCNRDAEFEYGATGLE
jgi:hypothetical protein